MAENGKEEYIKELEEMYWFSGNMTNCVFK
ncbi:MAG: hypothetical protein BWX72_00768 [Firmicutes bacterium ADurb.Bin080]|nr:MAG: hypothetical protein BWX72_00768 [Firmicutes bacterium ADurb.Bin080]